MSSHCYESSSRCLVIWHTNVISPCVTFLPNGIGKYSGLDLMSRDSWQFDDSPVHLEVAELCCFTPLTWKCLCCVRLSGAPQIHNCLMIRCSLLQYTEHSTYAIHHENGQSGTCICSLSIDFISYLSLYIIQIANEIPSNPMKSPSNSSNIWWLIRFKNDWEKGFIYAV